MKNEEIMWKFFKSKGLSDYACAGIIGNAFAESGLNPKNLEYTYQRQFGMSDEEYTNAVDNGTYDNFVYDKAGYGTFQFTYWSLKKGVLDYARKTKRSIGDLTMQLEYTWSEFEKSYSGMLNTLKNATSVLEASNAVLLKFERPADQSVAVQNKRASYGQKYYDKYAVNKNKGDDEMSYTKGESVKLSKNFASVEFDCHGTGCCSKTEIDPKLVDYLQKIRDHFNAPVTINSAYRCEKHNAEIGGASKSKHKYGQAADIAVKGITPAEVAKYAESIGILGIGLYEGKDGNFVHVDTRTTKAFWYGHANLYRSTFGGDNSSEDTKENIKPPLYVKGKTYRTQVEQLSVRLGAGTNYDRKTYAQLSDNAKKYANEEGYLKKNVAVSCMEVKVVGNDIWMRIPSGWCAAYYDGKYYIK